jgi:hypothetical protein
MKEKFKDINFGVRTLEIINKANEIVEDYQQQGFELTLRQLYYQFVSKALIENTERSYKNLGSIINDGRLAGMIDWEAIEDRTRHLRGNQHWNTPGEIARACAHSFYKDHWANQDFRIEVWVEKEALAGVAESACRPLDIPFFCCKGYTSQSEMYNAAQRLVRYDNEGKKAVIIHLGDHDPSGIDMSRDIEDRIKMFTYNQDFEFRRIALNQNQILEYNPPPNPAKMTDSRFIEYRKKFGDQSWELDALPPQVLASLIKNTVYEYRDPDNWGEVEAEQEKGKGKLIAMAAKIDKK